jgi:archaellum component FlaF (FlaF/FlaG flagellin family)
MRLWTDVKALSTIAIILIILISAVIGGIITYAFTIATYIRIPEGTTVTITRVYFDKENANSFKICILNPSYSPSNVEISRIAVSLKDEGKLYDIVETHPSIENGIVVPIGELLNITCSMVRRDNASIKWGLFAGEFAGETVILHVFSSNSTGSNLEAKLPLVKLSINGDFNPKVSFKRFNVTLANDLNSEVNLTVNEVVFSNIEVEAMMPDLSEKPLIIHKNESVCLIFNGSWHGKSRTNITVNTKEGYVFCKEFKLEGANATIQDITFNKEETGHFNVSIFNHAESANYLNVTKIECKLENGTKLQFDFDSVGILPNSTKTFRVNFNWANYREKSITLIAYFLQDFETAPIDVKTPP